MNRPPIRRRIEPVGGARHLYLGEPGGRANIALGSGTARAPVSDAGAYDHILSSYVTQGSQWVTGGGHVGPLLLRRWRPPEAGRRPRRPGSATEMA